MRDHYNIILDHFFEFQKISDEKEVADDVIKTVASFWNDPWSDENRYRIDW